MLPTLGDALWANAVAEKQIAKRTSSGFIVIFPSPSDPVLQIEKVNNRKSEQWDQKPLPFDIAWSRKLPVDVGVACEPC